MLCVNERHLIIVNKNINFSLKKRKLLKEGRASKLENKYKNFTGSRAYALLL